MTLREYMQTIRDNLTRDKALLQSMGYTASEKDMGYRSGLRYLGLRQTPETDSIADCMIYQRKFESVTKPVKLVQLSLFT